MFIIGSIGILVFAMWLADAYMDDYEIIKKVIIISLLALSCFFAIWDATSPTYVKSSREFMTNDYETYELNIDNDKLGLVEERVVRPTRKLTIVKADTEYYFKEFKE